MQKFLSYIIGWRLRRAERQGRMIEERAQHLMLKYLVEHDRMELEKQHEEMEAKKQIADAWMPFNPRRLTKGQAKALTLFDDNMIAAHEVLCEELRAELSNRSLIADGAQRDRALWAMVGVNMVRHALKQKIEHFGGQQKREKAKKQKAAEMAPKETPRSIMDLYGDQLMQSSAIAKQK